MEQKDFYIKLGEKFEKIDTIEENVVEIKNYLLDNGLVQDNAANKESIDRLWKYVVALFFLLLAAIRYGG